MLSIIEESFTTSPDGSLRIPEETMSAMGISAGSKVDVAYIADGNQINQFSEFLLSPASESNLPEQNFFLPNHLLEQAGFAPNDDLNIACIEGGIVIFSGDAINMEDLSELLDTLKLASDFLRDCDN